MLLSKNLNPGFLSFSFENWIGCLCTSTSLREREGERGRVREEKQSLFSEEAEDSLLGGRLGLAARLR